MGSKMEVRIWWRRVLIMANLSVALVRTKAIGMVLLSRLLTAADKDSRSSTSLVRVLWSTS
jgi:hypothetical protein